MLYLSSGLFIVEDAESKLPLPRFPFKESHRKSLGGPCYRQNLGKANISGMLRRTQTTSAAITRLAEDVDAGTPPPPFSFVMTHRSRC